MNVLKLFFVISVVIVLSGCSSKDDQTLEAFLESSPPWNEPYVEFHTPIAFHVEIEDASSGAKTNFEIPYEEDEQGRPKCVLELPYEVNIVRNTLVYDSGMQAEAQEEVIRRVGR